MDIKSRDLGINLNTGKDEETFKWFLACLLFGKPIQQGVAKQAYLEFIKVGLNSPEKILAAGWDHLVAVLDRGHYVRYDFSTATKLLSICKKLTESYGTITNIIRSANNEEELNQRLQEFKGIGPVTAKIFLREISLEQWKKEFL
ncbi:MAG: cytoplasmic protein [Promethearchaeota archaeon CR_4]|nr:MAG: cytoplasmic protein [Candidatus Lokiarchaeota archaeon CR_4]